jgi:hypothetical protein
MPVVCMTRPDSQRRILASQSASVPQAGGVYGSGNFTMSGGTVSGNLASYGGGVYVDGNANSSSSYGSFMMNGGTISRNTAHTGGGVFVYGDNSNFTKTGGIIYGDTDNIATNGNATDNTATADTNPGTNGHTVFYQQGTSSPYTYYYHNEDLTGADNISTTDTLPDDNGDTVGKWTMR